MLWVVLLLSVVAAAVATRSLEARRAAARAVQAAQLDAAADGAIRLSLRALVGNIRTPQWPAAVPASVQIDGTAVVVKVQSESARLDLNTGDENLLFAYFNAAGWEADAARKMVSRIRDWQDIDDTPGEGGLERDGYLAQEQRATPRNGPMESVEEIRQVVGAGDLSDQLLAGLTVYTHEAEPDGYDESGLVAQAVRLADKLKLGGRQWVRVDASKDPRPLTAGSVTRIRACAGGTAMMRCRETVVRLTGSFTEPVQVFVWRAVPVTDIAAK